MAVSLNLKEPALPPNRHCPPVFSDERSILTEPLGLSCRKLGVTEVVVFAML